MKTKNVTYRNELLQGKGLLKGSLDVYPVYTKFKELKQNYNS